MSDISRALRRDADGFITLSSVHFSAAMMAYLLGDLSIKKASDILDIDRQSHGENKIGERHKSNLKSMKTAYQALSPVQKAEFLLKMAHYPNLLQNGLVTEGWFDGRMGL